MTAVHGRLTRLGRALVPVRGPGRILAAATLVNTLGHGMFMAISTIYYVRVIGLSAAQVGTALTAAAVLAFAVTVPLGRLTDRIGARQMTSAANATGALLSASLVVVRGLAPLAVVLGLQAVAAVGSTVGRSAVVAGVFPPAERVKGRAYLRTLTNVGISAGAGLATPAIAVGTPTAYQVLIGCDAATFAVTGLLACFLPPSATPASRSRPGGAALRDRRFLMIAVINGVLSMQLQLNTVGVPLWVINRTSAPLWTPATLLIANTILVIMFQIRTSRGIDAPAAAAGAQRRAGLLLAAACLVYATAAGHQRYSALVVLLVAAVIHAFAEMLQAAGAWGLSYGLTPDERHGEYQAVFSLGCQLTGMLAPALVAFLTVESGTVGWAALALVFAVAGLAAAPATRAVVKPACG